MTAWYFAIEAQLVLGLGYRIQIQTRRQTPKQMPTEVDRAAAEGLRLPMPG